LHVGCFRFVPLALCGRRGFHHIKEFDVSNLSFARECTVGRQNDPSKRGPSEQLSKQKGVILLV